MFLLDEVLFCGSVVAFIVLIVTKPKFYS